LERWDIDIDPILIGDRSIVDSTSRVIHEEISMVEKA